MPVKKKSATKSSKKTTVKKAVTAKKSKVAITKKTATKKIVNKKETPKKTVAKKITSKKTATKKVAPQKISTKKTAAKKAVTKKTTVKKAVKKETKKTKTTKTKKTTSKKVVDSTFKRPANLAKTILSKTSEKKPEIAAPEEKKNDLLQKIIIARRPEGKNRVTFKIGDYAVYPSHGVGKIIEIEKTTILGSDFSCYLMNFEAEKLVIKVPMDSAEKIGLRHLISKKEMDEVFSILRSGIKKLKGMWSRRAQEYETKINSGDIILLAEVLRDLTRDIEDSERSYSERIIYETAIYRLAGEYAAIYGIDFEEAKEKITMTAKDKLNSEGKIIQKDDFDDFDDEDYEDGDEDDDDDEYEDEDDDD